MLNILVSYAFLRKNNTWFGGSEHSLKEIMARGEINLLVDSGAFTAFKSGTSIILEEYLDFIKTNNINKYFVLDVMGDKITTRKNLLTMYRKGFKPIPIFTRGADGKDIEEMYEMSDLVALGGVAVPSPNKLGYIKWFMNNICKGRRIHWLGWGDRDFLLHYKPESIDNSNWSYARRVGKTFFVDQRNYMSSFYRRDVSLTQNRELQKFCIKIGIDWEEFVKESLTSVKHPLLDIMNTASCILLAHDLEKRIKTVTYFGITNLDNLNEISKGYKQLKEKGVLS